MRLATFKRSGATEAEIGVVERGELFPLSISDSASSLDMKKLIASWDRHKEGVQGRPEEGGALGLEDVTLLAPVPRPSKIMAIGLNYADHVAESGLTTPPHQIWFAKMPNTVNPPFAPILLPTASEQLDYEVELVAIVGRRSRRLTRESAPDHVFGYCVGNDVSIRDWQLRTPQWVLGKSGDTHAPFGPWITTADEVDPHALSIQSYVNGELRQSSDTRHLIFDVYDQLVELSKIMTLEPGDVIFTGTPGGVGVAMKPPQFLRAGDKVACEVENLGRIEAVVVSEASTARN